MPTKEQEIETAPDPEEDDLDDLDDVLDEFDAKPKSSSSQPPSGSAAPAPAQKAPTVSGSGRSDADATTTDDATDTADLQSQLQTGMANLIGQLGENPEMQKQFEDMMQELIAAGAAPTDKETAEHIRNASESVPKEPSSTTSGKKDDNNFQDTIRRTMERMQQSGDAATAATASTGGGGAGGSAGVTGEDEMLAQMMRELGAAGEGGDEDFNKMLMSMMTQLTNKEILYEPMKELNDKFPEWMEKNRATTKKEDLERYEQQEKLVREIVQRFERNGYSDQDENDREYIVDRMQKMQAAGSPPPDLVGDMSAAQEAIGDLDAGCPMQ